MNKSIKTKLIEAYSSALRPRFDGTLNEWCYQNLSLPSSFAISGRVQIDNSPYLKQPALDLLDPRVRQVNLIAAVQGGKSFLAEAYIPYLMVNDGGNIMRVHVKQEMAEHFTSTRVVPILQNCPAIAPMLKTSRYAVKKSEIQLPHCHFLASGPAESSLHGISVRTVLLDEAHLLDPGVIAKAINRTTAFASNRKIVISSTPNECGTELHTTYENSTQYEWQYYCNGCNKHQPYQWTARREDGTFYGLNWLNVENPDGTTSISKTARTAWVECVCGHEMYDNPQTRREMLDNGAYVCIKDGDAASRSYSWSIFTNVGISFEAICTAGMLAKRNMKELGIKTEWVNFINQYLGKFYKHEIDVAQSTIQLGEMLTDEQMIDGVKIMSVDVQDVGNLKYYTIRWWKKGGNESQLIATGVERTFDGIFELAAKHNINTACIGFDSGFQATEIYAESIRRGKLITLKNGKLHYASPICFKGSGKASFTHPDGVERVYSIQGEGDCQWTQGHKYKGIHAKLIQHSNYAIKTILARLRDNQINGVSWKGGAIRDYDWEEQLRSEGLQNVVDKKTGVSTQRWIKNNDRNHLLDCEAMSLCHAIMLGYFSPINTYDPAIVAKLSKDDILLDKK